MTSENKCASNRANANKSSGPKSGRGKALTRFNSVKHGGFAIQRLLHGEDEVEYRQLSAAIVAETLPNSTIESMLVDQIISDMWRLKRLERADVAYFDRVRKSIVTGILTSLSDAEFEAARGSDVDEELLRSGARARRERQAAFDLELAGLGVVPRSRPSQKTVSASEAEAAMNSMKRKLEHGDSLDEMLLDGIAASDKAFAYTTIDNIRRSLVREIKRNYADLLKLQQIRFTIEPQATDEISPSVGAAVSST